MWRKDIYFGSVELGWDHHFKKKWTVIQLVLTKEQHVEQVRLVWMILVMAWTMQTRIALPKLTNLGVNASKITAIALLDANLTVLLPAVVWQLLLLMMLHAQVLVLDASRLLIHQKRLCASVQQVTEALTTKHVPSARVLSTQLILELLLVLSAPMVAILLLQPEVRPVSLT